MARFSVCGGDDGEGPSNRSSRKRQRLPSIDEEDAEENSDAGSSGEEDERETRNPLREEDTFRCLDSDDQGSTSDDSDREVVIEETRFGKSVNDQSSSNKDSPLSVTLLDPDVLDCPICCEPLKIPIFQCDNGHLSCSICCTKVRNICPSCTLPIGYIRCRAMEKVVEASRVSCPNANYGCKENTSYGNRFIHEKLCVFVPCSCPILNCNYTGYYKDLNNHVRAKHKEEVIPFILDLSVSISLDLDKKTTILQEVDDGEVIIVQVFRGLHGACVSVSRIAPLIPEVGKFSCSLVNLTSDSLLKQGLMVKNIQKVRNEEPEDGFMLIPSYLLLSGNNDNLLDLQISIGRGRSFVRT